MKLSRQAVSFFFVLLYTVVLSGLLDSLNGANCRHDLTEDMSGVPVQAIVLKMKSYNVSDKCVLPKGKRDHSTEHDLIQYADFYGRVTIVCAV